MNKDIKILDYISKNQNISQRELAEHAGLSLGNVNLLIQKMAQKGFIKIEKLNTNTLYYTLTPQGFEEKMKKTYRYMRECVRTVLDLKQKIIEITNLYTSRGYTIYLYGEEDEIYEMLRQSASDKSFCRLQWIKNTERLPQQDKEVLFLVWQMDKVKELQEQRIDYINLLS